MINLVQNFYKQTVLSPWATGTGNRYVSVKPTVSAGYLVISPNSESLREIVAYSATGTDGGGDYVTLSARGLGGTTDQAHGIGERVYMNITAQHIADIDTALQDLEDDKLETTYLDTDGTLAANSDLKIATQKATKTYVDTTTVGATGDETVAGVKTFSSSPIVPAPTTDSQAATKKYADDLAIAGAPNASTTVKGIVEEATQAEIAAGTAAGATAARLFTNPSTLITFLRDAIETSSATTHSLTTAASQKVVAFAKGNISGLPDTTAVTVTLKYNGVTKDTTTIAIDTDGVGGLTIPFSLMYIEVPGAATQNITIETTSGSINNPVITVIKF